MTKRKWLTTVLAGCMLASATVATVSLVDTASIPDPITAHAATWDISAWKNPDGTGTGDIRNWTGDPATTGGTMTTAGIGHEEFSYYLTANTTSTQNYTVSTTWQASFNACDATDLDVGIFASYTDENNYLLFFLRYVDLGGTMGRGLHSMYIREVVGGTGYWKSSGDVIWGDNIGWLGAITDRYASTAQPMKMAVERTGSLYEVYINNVKIYSYTAGVTHADHTAYHATATSNKFGLYASADAGSVTFTEFKQEDTKVTHNVGGVNYTALKSAYSVSGDKLVSTSGYAPDANLKSSALTPISSFGSIDATRYVMTTTATTTGDNQRWGLIPFYQDEKNYIMVNLFWGNRDGKGDILLATVWTQVVDGVATTEDRWTNDTSKNLPQRDGIGKFTDLESIKDDGREITLTISRFPYDNSDHYHLMINGLQYDNFIPVAENSTITKATAQIGYNTAGGSTTFNALRVKNNKETTATVFGKTATYQEMMWDVEADSLTYTNDAAFKDPDINERLYFNDWAASGNYAVEATFVSATHAFSYAFLGVWQADAENNISVKIDYSDKGTPWGVSLLSYRGGVYQGEQLFPLSNTTTDAARIRVERLTGETADLYKVYYNDTYLGEKTYDLSAGVNSTSTYVHVVGDWTLVENLAINNVETVKVTYQANGQKVADFNEVKNGKLKLTADKAAELTEGAFIAWRVGNQILKAGAEYLVTGDVTIEALKIKFTAATPTVSVLESLAGTKLSFSTTVDATDYAYVKNALGAEDSDFSFHTVLSKNIYYNGNYTLAGLNGQRFETVGELANNAFGATFTMRAYELATALTSISYVVINVNGTSYTVDTNAHFTTSSYALIAGNDTLKAQYQASMLNTIVQTNSESSSATVASFNALYIGTKRIAIRNANGTIECDSAYTVTYNGTTLTWTKK